MRVAPGDEPLVPLVRQWFDSPGRHVHVDGIVIPRIRIITELVRRRDNLRGSYLDSVICYGAPVFPCYDLTTEHVLVEVWLCLADAYLVAPDDDGRDFTGEFSVILAREVGVHLRDPKDGCVRRPV